MTKDKENQIISSALWAAYGDALGFPTELVSEKDFAKRNGHPTVEEPVSWVRRIGGLFGPEIPLPAGTYSDDTQLRLSTSRAIRGDGYFDVESFAKIELPVWLNYALGAGRGSKAAAANLSLKESTWSQNFFRSNGSNYIEGGGNGAAMRIQPHVWANHRAGSDAFMGDVIRNTICTHGHPRAIIGAAIHAMALYQCLETGIAVGHRDWASIGETAAVLAYEMLVEDEELALVWIPNWESHSQKELKAIWATTVLEWQDSVERATEICLQNMGDAEGAYRTCLAELGGYSNAERGSGLKTALYAMVLSWLYKNEHPSKGLAVAANCFKSDTDTIATMAGALMGATCPNILPSTIQDLNYIRQEATRLYLIGLGEKQKSFEYPDLLKWSPPRNQSDAWQSIGNEETLMGLGRLEPDEASFDSTKGTEITWQWCSLAFGQTVLAKRRKSRGKSPQETIEDDMRPISTAAMKAERFSPSQRDLLTPRTLDDLTRRAIQSGFSPEVIGECLLELTHGPMAIEQAIAFAAIIAKARIARKPQQ